MLHEIKIPHSDLTSTYNAEEGEPGISIEEVFATYGMPTLAQSQIYDPSQPRTLEVVSCNKIILKNKTLDFVFEIEQPKIEEFEKIIINGITFVKEKERCNNL